MSALTLSTLAGGAFSERPGAARLALRDEAAWQAVWQEHAPGEPAPEVDFSRDAVLAVFAGQKPSTGWSVEFGEVGLTAAVLTVRFRLRPPLGLAQDVLTQPFHIAKVSREGWGRAEFIPVPG